MDRNSATGLTTAVDSCRPLRGGVDRNELDHEPCHVKRKSPPTRGRGSKRSPRKTRFHAVARRPLRGGVDRNSFVNMINIHNPRRPLRGGVDRNCRIQVPCESRAASPPTRGRGSKRWLARDGGVDWKSPPTRGRGSKQQHRIFIAGDRIVAPYAGAWIETPIRRRAVLRADVAPYAGAWIETIRTASTATSRSTVAPYAGAWIETAPRGSAAGSVLVAPYAGAWIETSCVRSRSRSCSDGRPLRGGVDRNGFVDDLVHALARRPLRGGVDRNVTMSAH